MLDTRTSPAIVLLPPLFTLLIVVVMAVFTSTHMELGIQHPNNHALHHHSSIHR